MFKLGKWMTEGGMSAEVETGEFLAGLVRLMKPDTVVETGTADASTSLRIAQALQQNGSGTLYTCDTDVEKWKAAETRLSGLPVRAFCQTGLSLIESCAPQGIDLLFIDSWWNPVRTEELLSVTDSTIKPWGIVALHDPLNNYKPSYDAFCAARGWQNMVIKSAYGLALWQRPIQWPAEQEPIPERVQI